MWGVVAVAVGVAVLVVGVAVVMVVSGCPLHGRERETVGCKEKREEIAIVVASLAHWVGAVTSAAAVVVVAVVAAVVVHVVVQGVRGVAGEGLYCLRLGDIETS